MRYGTRLMVRMGLVFGRKPVLLKIIAKSEDISEEDLSQIILSLKAASFVISFRGVHGGYTLAKYPSKIKISNTSKVLEGDFKFVECCKDLIGCERISLCITRNLWSKMVQNIEERISSKTLADKVMQCKEKEQSTVMYNI